MVTASLSPALHILVVADFPDLLSSIKRLLNRAGHSVVAVPCLQQALKKISETKFGVLLSDVHLPDGTGCELLGRIANTDRPQHAIVMSIHRSHGFQRASEAAGFQRYLMKPFGLKTLLNAVQQTTGE